MKYKNMSWMNRIKAWLCHKWIKTHECIIKENTKSLDMPQMSELKAWIKRRTWAVVIWGWNQYVIVGREI